MRRRSEKVSPEEPLSWALKGRHDGVLLPSRADGKEERAEQRKPSIKQGLRDGRGMGGSRRAMSSLLLQEQEYEKGKRCSIGRWCDIS